MSEIEIYQVNINQSNPNWTHSPEYMLIWLKMKQQYFNNRLSSEGFLFLNDVLQDLGVPRTKRGQTWGWCIAGSRIGQYVDFGIWTNEQAEDLVKFMNGKAGQITLNLNTQGDIMDRVWPW